MSLSPEYRTHTCGELRGAQAGTAVRLSGWLHNRRDLGGVLFLDLRDHYGLVQLVVAPGSSCHGLLSHLPKESVIRVDGAVARRDPATVNAAIETGEIEVRVEVCEVLSRAEALPFSVFPEQDTPEELRLQYRYLDLRRPRMHANVMLRTKVVAFIRDEMRRLGFTELATPILTNSSPEGARDFLVPSRLHPGQFYALPQAPQQFKQLFMVAGFDRYFQIAPCFRDEDSRADRSPGEFYQLDLEMSFVTQEDVFAVVETVLPNVFGAFAGSRAVTPAPFPRLTYAEAMVKFGTDKPDLRIPIEMRDATELLAGVIPFFGGKRVRALPAPGGASRPRSFFDGVVARATQAGADGLGYLAVKPGAGLSGPLAKFIPAELHGKVREQCGIGEGDAAFFYASADEDALHAIVAPLRRHIGEGLGLAEKDAFRFCWITDFPMYAKDPETRQIVFNHNPFSMPQGGMDALNAGDPLAVKAWQYDIVCNGIELSSGAIRNHRSDILYRAFEIAGYPKETVDEKFPALATAFKYGPPPHGGIAPGIDRIVMLLTGEENLRETIAFPLNQKAQDLLMGAPGRVTARQLKDLHIRIVEEPEPGAPK
ncbi:MAG: aspartate--tRNA ligase [Candidatus Coatesbacteria bacterium]